MRAAADAMPRLGSAAAWRLAVAVAAMLAGPAVAASAAAPVVSTIPDDGLAAWQIAPELVIRSATGVEARDLQVQIGQPDRIAIAHTAPMSRPRSSAVTLGQAADPYANGAARHVERIDNPDGFFGGDSLGIAAVEDPRGGAMIALGHDMNHDGLPSPDEERCRASSVDFVASCALLHVYDSWAMAWSPLAGPSPVVVTSGTAGGTGGVGELYGKAWVSAAGRSDADGLVDTRWSVDAPMTADGRMAFGAIAVDMQPLRSFGFAERTLVPVRLVRSGVDPVQRTLSTHPYSRTPDMVVEPGDPPKAIVVDVPYGSISLELFVGHAENVNAQIAIRHDPAPDYTGPWIPPLDLEAADVHREFTGRTGTRLFFDDLTDGALGGRWYVVPVNFDSAQKVFAVSAASGFTVVDEALPIAPGSYYNPARPGHGVFLHPAGDQMVMLWYAYDELGRPTWYYAQGEKIDDGIDRYELTLYRTAWLGDRQKQYPVGSISLTGIADGEFVMSWQLDARTGSERFVPFLSGCPSVDGAPLDVAAHWFDPARSGTGYSVAVAPGYEFIAAYLYDGLGRPRFLAAERSGAFAAEATGIELHQLEGFAPLAAWSAVQRTPIGLLDRQYAGGALDTVEVDAVFVGGVPGEWHQLDKTVPLTATQGCD